MNNLKIPNFFELPIVKAEFKEEFERSRLNQKEIKILAPVITSNPQLTGTVFDYLMRFFLTHLNPNAISGKWVAEKALEELSESNYRSEAKNTIKTAKKNLNRYLKTGRMDDELIVSAFNLAKLDNILRAGNTLPFKRSEPDKNDIQDLRQLISVINPKTFKAEHICILNPEFGSEDSELMNADGDLVIDGTLIDIKTYKTLKVGKKIFNQLLAYYTLYRIGGIRGMPSSNQITKLGFYFSRHGYLHTYEVKDIIDEIKYASFIEWVKEKELRRKT